MQWSFILMLPQNEIFVLICKLAIPVILYHLGDPVLTALTIVLCCSDVDVLLYAWKQLYVFLSFFLCFFFFSSFPHSVAGFEVCRLITNHTNGPWCLFWHLNGCACSHAESGKPGLLWRREILCIFSPEYTAKQSGDGAARDGAWVGEHVVII